MAKRRVPAKKTKTSALKRKLVARTMTGTYVGIVERTGEHVLVGANGRAVRVRTVKRAPVQLRWTQKPILEMKAIPRRPDPSSKAPEIKPMFD